MSSEDERSKRTEQMAELADKMSILKVKQVSIAAGCPRDGADSPTTVVALCEDGSVWIISPHSADAVWTRLPEIRKAQK